MERLYFVNNGTVFMAEWPVRDNMSAEEWLKQYGPKTGTDIVAQLPDRSWVNLRTIQWIGLTPRWVANDD